MSVQGLYWDRLLQSNSMSVTQNIIKNLQSSSATVVVPDFCYRYSVILNICRDDWLYRNGSMVVDSPDQVECPTSLHGGECPKPLEKYYDCQSLH